MASFSSIREPLSCCRESSGALPQVVTTHLDGDALADALVSGIHRVISEQDFLNHINVFPVADGDTGTNLSLSLGSALEVLTRPGEKHLGTLLASIADALTDFDGINLAVSSKSLAAVKGNPLIEQVD